MKQLPFLPLAPPVAFAAFLVAGAVACGDGNTPSPSPTEAAPSPTLAHTPTPSPTPIVEAVPEGWERHTTAHIQIDLPETWEVFDPSEETPETIEMTLEEVITLKPDFATELEELVTQIEELVTQAETDLVALDTEFLNFFVIRRLELSLPSTVAAFIADFRKNAAAQGLTVLASDSSLTIGGSRAGSFQVSFTQDPDQISSQYIVLPEPTLAFTLIFSATADDFDALKLVFDQIAQSFRVLEAP